MTNQAVYQAVGTDFSWIATPLLHFLFASPLQEEQHINLPLPTRFLPSPSSPDFELNISRRRYSQVLAAVLIPNFEPSVERLAGSNAGGGKVAL